MTACTEGHLFCLNCAKMNAETTVGNGQYVFKCMDTSGCKAEFPSHELVRFVDEKVAALRDKLQAGEVLRVVPFPMFNVAHLKASIEGFVTCPFCDYGAIMENPDDKEFRCENKDCSIVSCRVCREETHIPLSCEGIMNSVLPANL
jgi:TRIAD3 protein (E3 ubiquitin-protein ligase RNF216)